MSKVIVVTRRKHSGPAAKSSVLTSAEQRIIELETKLADAVRRGEHQRSNNEKLAKEASCLVERVATLEAKVKLAGDAVDKVESQRKEIEHLKSEVHAAQDHAGVICEAAGTVMQMGKKESTPTVTLLARCARLEDAIRTHRSVCRMYGARAHDHALHAALGGA
jgi:septal ring factor EnvC (AmiA/AmiB activator)